jgi:DNA-binding CsgD family transcriptional regulator
VRQGPQSEELCQVSNLIGTIYDCAIDPSRWEATLDAVRRLLQCANAHLIVVDIPHKVERTQFQVGTEPTWATRAQLYEKDRVELFDAIPNLYTRPLDEPVVLRREVSEDLLAQNRYAREWAKPQGLCDVIAIWLMREPTRAGYLGMGRHESVGPIGEREIGLMRLLAPHLRRAVTIGDLMDMQTLKGEALETTLDMLKPGVIIATAEGGIVHANRTARRMMDERDLIVSVAGRIATSESRRAEQLRQAIAAAAHNECELGSTGIGMAIKASSGRRATAHVLPLGRNGSRARLLPRGAAAIFIATEDLPGADLRPVAQALSLTRAELRLLERLMVGDALVDAATALGIKYSTAHTHLIRILSKAGVSRQASLLALVNRLLPPLMAGQQDQQVPSQ